MATDLAGAASDFRDLARNLIAVGDTELKQELYDAINEAAQPVADEIKGLPHLREYMPDRYAGVLAGDLRVTTHKYTGPEPGVTIFARAPTVGRGGRKIRQRDSSVITHPLFGNKKRWFTQVSGMRPGFFTAPAERAAPDVAAKIIEAMHRVEEKALGR